METCGRCTAQLVGLAVEDSMEIAGQTFTARLPARRCPKCGDILIDARDVQEFERAAILALARSGQRTGSVLRVLRKSADLAVSRLAELLGVPSESVMAWEEGADAVPPAAAAMLRGIVVSKLDGGAEPMDALGVLRQPRQLARKVRLHLKVSLEKIAAALATTATA